MNSLDVCIIISFIIIILQRSPEIRVITVGTKYKQTKNLFPYLRFLLKFPSCKDIYVRKNNVIRYITKDWIQSKIKHSFFPAD